MKYNLKDLVVDDAILGIDLGVMLLILGFSPGKIIKFFSCLA